MADDSDFSAPCAEVKNGVRCSRWTTFIDGDPTPHEHSFPGASRVMGERMTDAELDAAEALAAAATEGPWRVGYNYGGGASVFVDERDPVAENMWEQNAEFIAAARSLVPRLVAEVRALTREMHSRELHHFESEVLLDEARAEVRARDAVIDEAEEKLTFLESGCVKLTREELIQRITAVGPARWKAGIYWEQRERPLRAAIEAVRELHHEGIAYADDVDEASDVPDDHERHFCHEDGEDWPCATIRALEGATGGE